MAQQSLYRGRVMGAYDFPFNGHYYWYSPAFQPGVLCYNGTVYEDVNMNFNSHTQEALVRESQFTAPIVLESSLLPWFWMGGINYVNLRMAGFEDAPEGYFQVLSDGNKTYYFQRRKLFVREPGNHNGPKGIGYNDPNYRDNIISYFYQQDSYYIVKRGQLKQVHPGAHKRASLKAISPDDTFASTNESRKLVSGGVVAPVRTWEDLPAGWFAQDIPSSERSAMLAAIEQEKLIASYRNKTYEIGAVPASQGPVKVGGIVRDVATGEVLSGVFVSDSGGRNYCYTGADGAYELRLPLGENVLQFREYSKEDMDIRVVVKGAGVLDIVMREKVTALKSAYVTANTMAEHRRTGMGLEQLSSATLTHIPSAFGEGDVLKAVLTLPGVKSTGEASSGINVRGGSADQNLILFNGGTIYNPSHLFGIFSAFNTDVVDDVDLYKSSIPVEYGGRISSVLDIRSKDGNPERIKGSVGLGLLTSHLALEGPIVKNKTTFVLGGRTTYSDWLLKQLPKDSGYAGGKGSFSDVNIGITHRFDARNTLKLSGYWSRDNFSFVGDTTFRYSNLDVSVMWKHKWEAQNSLEVSAGFDRYGNTLENTSTTDGRGAYTLDTRIRQVFTKASVKQQFGRHMITWGADAVVYALDPGTMNPLDLPATDPDVPVSRIVPKVLPTETAVEPSLFVGDLWRPGDGTFSLDYGIRYSSFLAFSPAKYYGAPEFRVSGKYSPAANFSVKAGFNSMNQYIHLISNTASISPMDTWKLCDADIRPQHGYQAAGGIYWTAFENSVDISLEAYYKRSYNYLDYKSGAVLSMNENLADDLVRTTGKSYGVELMLRKQTGRLTGWVSYTWSRAMLKEMEYRGVETINNGEWYNAPFDQPHDFKLVSNYKFTHRFSLSCNVNYTTGRPVTIPVGQYLYGNSVRLIYSGRNAYRIPDYFRLDLALNIEPSHYLKALTHMSATIGCYNVTGRKNAYSVYYSTNGGNKVQGYMISVFATQVPYASINIKF